MEYIELLQQLNRLEERYQAWVVPINQAIRDHLVKINRGGSTTADYEKDIRAIQESQRSKYDPYQEIYILLDILCPAYLRASDEERANTRIAVSDKNGVLSALLGYTYRAAGRIHAPTDLESLQLGLAAVSIENCSKDYRDVLLALAELWVKAEEAGIRPGPAFRAIAKLSSAEKPRGGDTCLRKMLGNFQSYGALRERRKRSK